MPLAMLGDERLARLVADGHERAFSALFARYHQQLYRYCHSMVRHEADAQDALQSTFTAALVALRRSQRDAPLRPWLFRIAHNESVSLLRRRRPGDELSEDMASLTPSVEDAAHDRVRLAQLVADLQMLPERQRGALVMRELGGLSHEDVSQALGISLGAAKQTVFEARKALQEFAEGRAMHCEEIQRTISDRDGRALRGRRVRAHLRDCSTCSAFATAIPERRTALMALSPALPALAASGLLARITGTGSLHHGGGGSLLAGATGKSMGIVVSAKTLATGAAIVATAAAGATGAVELATHSGSSPASTHLVRNPGHAGQSTGGATGSRGQHGSAAAGNARGRAAGRHGAGQALGHNARASASRGGKNGLTATRHSAGATTGNASTTGHAPASAGTKSNGTNPNAGGTNPNAHGGNPNAGGGNPNAGGGSTNAHGTNPNAGGTNPNAHGGNPNAGGGNLNVGSGSTNAHGGNPNAGGGNLNVGSGSTNAHGGNPNAGSGSTNAHGGNPNGAHSLS
jgi:RNA polymerase sigma factor (sigma-70 family)